MDKILFFSQHLKKKNQKKWQRFFTNLVRISFLVILIGVIFFELYYLVTSTSYLEIKQIKVTGNKKIDSRILLRTANVYPGMKFYRLDKKATMTRIKSLVWVKNVGLDFSSMRELDIRIEERNPEAVVFSNDYFYEVDAEGVVLVKGIKNIDESLAIITGLKLNHEFFEGERIEDRKFLLAIQWIDNLKNFLLEDISEINVENEIKVYFFTINGVKIFPGEFVRFKENYPVVKKELELASKIKANIDYIDMRYDNEIIYKSSEK
ncbi:MAG: FtsQ-type POTRA domain-containing protein [Candidatus Wallbacteria bacterium]|nr:FtsQ-type POTRA domain-containing protein [Candidatus Wallbacteria bacterium]